MVLKTLAGMGPQHGYGIARGRGEIGIRAALGLGRVVGSLLFGLTADDVGTVLGTFAVLGITGIAAGALPALRASRIEPIEALRYE